MGAPNVHPDWTPGENAILRTDEFQNPQHLAEYLKFACNNDTEYAKFFEWKKRGLSPQFQQKVKDCVFYGAQCRLCEYVAKQRKKLSEEQRSILEERRVAHHEYHSISFTQAQHIEIPSSPHLHLLNHFSITAWIKVTAFNGTIFDRQVYRLGLKTVWKRNYLEFCVKSRCYVSSYPLKLATWTHFVLVFSYGEENYVKWYVNGDPDKAIEIPYEAPKVEDYVGDMPLIIGTNTHRSNHYHGLIDDVSHDHQHVQNPIQFVKETT